MVAMGLLISAKLLNVGVPFLFKYAIDHLNVHLDTPLHLSDPQGAVLTTTLALLMGCKQLPFISLLFCFKLDILLPASGNRRNRPVRCCRLQRTAQCCLRQSIAAFSQRSGQERVPSSSQPGFGVSLESSNGGPF